MFKPESELQFKKIRNPIMNTVEVDVDGLEAKGLSFPGAIVEALEYARKTATKPDAAVSVYTYFTGSCTFREPTYSAFVGVIGNQKMLRRLEYYFRGYLKVNARMGESIESCYTRLEYHVQDGKVWYRSGTSEWEADCDEDEEMPE